MELLQLETVELDVEGKNAINAIRLAGDLLVNAKKAKPDYVDAMVKGYTDIGPYIVIAPGIAIPHARPEEGALQTGLSIIRLTTSIAFGHESNDPVKLVCALVGIDKSSHLEMLRQISKVFGNKEKLHTILTTEDKLEVVHLFNNT
ncbi:PTS sugar transporter subunit IIA [Shimazuella kribbensis]|uniref:PTS sugar transporter subunit IIA n=1 Tax=Shimazuella kribbensis TaxID=139808 RepID=UPI00041994F1|nr:PTS sugar transporter subunit IIA [Shimazuella kribbensis]